MSTQTFDVVVIGGGAAGLSGALTLARARRSVLVIDAGEPRNAPADGVHNYLAREGTPPAELYAAGRAEVAGYGGEFRRGTVVGASSVGTDTPRFLVELAEGEPVAARRLLVTTGLVDELPAIPGVAQQWGHGVLHCPYCHGWEVRDHAIGVLATSAMSVHQTLLFRQWSHDVVYFQHTAPDLTAEQAEQFAARGIRTVSGEVAGLEIADGTVAGVRLATGEVVARQAVVVAPRFTARSGLLTALGVETAEQHFDGHVVGTYVASGLMGATSVPGVRVAGNVADIGAQVISAAAGGVGAGAALNMELVTEDTGLAVAEYRARR